MFRASGHATDLGFRAGHDAALHQWSSVAEKINKPVEDILFWPSMAVRLSLYNSHVVSVQLTCC